MAITNFTIQDQAEETECYWCGFPLYVGDKVYTSSETEDPACSVLCAIRLSNRSHEE